MGLIIHKRCGKCGEYKPFSDFNKEFNVNGISCWCKSCCHEYYISHKEENKKQRKEYKRKNKERIRVYQKEYNKEYQKKYNKKNRERIREYYKKYRHERKTNLKYESK